MEKIGKDGTGERSDVEDDKSRKKLKRSPNKNLSDPDSINSGNSGNFLEKLSEDGKEGKGGDDFSIRSPLNLPNPPKTDKKSKAHGKGEFSSTGDSGGLGKTEVDPVMDDGRLVQSNQNNTVDVKFGEGRTQLEGTNGKPSSSKGQKRQSIGTQKQKG